MSLPRSSIDGIDRRAVGFGLVWLLTVVLLVPIQLASMILFDSTGLDAIVPDIVFMAIVPGLVLALFPAFAARSLYSSRSTRATAGVAFGTFAIVAAYTMRFYGLCGPGC